MARQRTTEVERTDASKVEATATELAAAVAAVEARRDASIRKDTISIGDAIGQLGFDVTPEELVSEIESQQRARLAVERLARHRKSKWKKWLVAALLTLSLGLNVKLLTTPGISPTTAITSMDRVYEQSGRFNAIAGKEGLVRFPVPYQAVPNLELSHHPQLNKTFVTETKSWGFRWKNNGPDDLFNNGSIAWKARGMR